MADAARITVRVTPRGGRDTIVGWREGSLAVRIAASPIEGAANASLVRLLAKRLSVPPSNILVIAGTRSRVKTIEVRTLGQQETERRLGAI